jgi:mitogen-activated protein kinase 15
VWKVVEKTTKKTYALKKIFDAFQHATDAQRTYREVSILSQLSHENIIQLKETIKAENQKDLYLVFEYMEADLHNVIG